MEAETRTVLYEYNADEALPPASVTKVMTLLLTMEAVDSGRIALTDTISVSEMRRLWAALRFIFSRENRCRSRI